MLDQESKHKKFKTLLRLTGAIVVGASITGALLMHDAPVPAKPKADSVLTKKLSSKANFSYPMAVTTINHNHVCYTDIFNPNSEIPCDTSNPSLAKTNNDIITATSCIANMGFAKELQNLKLTLVSFKPTGENVSSETMVKRFPLGNSPDTTTFDRFDGGPQQMDFMRQNLQSSDYELLETSWREFQKKSNNPPVGTAGDLYMVQDDQGFQEFLTSSLQEKDKQAWERINSVRIEESNRLETIDTVFNNFSYTLLSDKFNHGAVLHQATSSFPSFQQKFAKEIVVNLFSEIMHVRLQGGCHGLPKDYRDIVYDKFEKEYKSQKLEYDSAINKPDEVEKLNILSAIKDEKMLVTMQNDGTLEEIGNRVPELDGWLSSLSLADYGAVVQAKNTIQGSLTDTVNQRELAGLSKNISLLSMEIVDGLDDKFINLSPGEMLSGLTKEVLNNFSKYGLDKKPTAYDYILKNKKTDSIDRINNAIREENNNSVKPVIEPALESLLPNNQQLIISSRIDHLRKIYALVPEDHKSLNHKLS